MLRLHALIAHQGGWDEILLFGIPVVVALIAVRLVERRHLQRAREDTDESESTENPASRASEEDDSR